MEKALIEFGLLAISVLLGSQVLAPGIFGKPMFSWFRKTNLEKAHEDLKERKEEALQQLRIVKLQEETMKLEVEAEIARNSMLDSEIEEKFSKKE